MSKCDSMAVRANPGAVGRSGGSWHKEILDPSLPATESNVKAAQKWILSKWRQRAKGLGRPTPADLRGSCKFSSIFARKVFGGKMEGNKLHQFNRLPDGTLLDLNESASDVLEMKNPHVHDPRFWGNRDHTESMSSCRPAAESWADEFLAQMKSTRPNPGPKRRTPAILRHCVAKVAPTRGVPGAYAICTASLQRAGVMRGGTLTAAGKRRDAARRTRTPANKAKDAAFERALRAPNQKDLRAVAEALRVARRIRSDATARITRETPDYPILHVQYPRTLPWKSIARLEREVDKLGWRAWGIDERGIAFKPTSSVDIE